jgi:DNA polymerase-3 subunit alpha
MIPPPGESPIRMSQASFAHLHVHTEFSLLDGACRIEELVGRAAQLGMDSVAMTDHGVLYGTIQFYRACQKHRLRPIIGCEVYVAPRTRHDREGKLDSNLAHLVLLASDDEGYRNLVRMVSASHLEGFYYKPRVDRELLAAHSKGLIALSACLAGEIPMLLLQRRESEARQLAGAYRELFGPGNFYLELMSHGIPEQARVNLELVRLGQELGIPTVATNDVHYLRQEDAAAHDVLLCIQTGATVDEPSRLRFPGDQFYLKSLQEMEQLFAEQPQALTATRDIAERCNVKLALGEIRLPHFQVPDGHDHISYLRALCLEHLPRRFPNADEEIMARLDSELDIIGERQLAPLILISWDAVHFARENGILVGPGRGSAVGSLVLYILGVTNIDPIEHGLPFERWMNLERLSMPDIDSDFEDSRRDEVIRHIIERYGAERVAQIITFGTMGPRLAIRDAGRAMKMPLADVDRIAKLVDPTATISQSLDTVLELSHEYQGDAQVRKLIDTAMAVEGLARHASTHAGGLVISECPLTDIVPLQRSTEGEGVTTQFKWEDVVDVGLLKLDVLGLRTLSVIKHALALIRESRGVELDLERIPFDDAATYALLARGETAGVFQLESSGMRQVLMDLRPDRFSDIIAVVALYRPGPMAYIDDFVSGRHGARQIDYGHPKLKPILEETYGIIVYQEQVMQIARQLAGFSMASADSLLNAMRKKKHEAMAKLREEFIEGAKANRVPKAVADDLFDRMAVFSGYGFNKAHAACYALNAYQTAYLKANYPAEFMAAQLTSVGDNKDKVAAYIEECRRMGISVLPPDINQSGESFTVSGGAIRFGLAAIKHVGKSAVESIIRARGSEPYTDLYDLCSRADPASVNRTAIEALATAGALDCLPGHRRQLVQAAGEALDAAARAHRDRQAGQVSLFGDDLAEHAEVRWSLPPAAEFSQDELLALEKEYLGLFVSDHPLSSLAEELQQHVTARACDLGEMEEGSDATIGGLVNSCRRYTAKSGRPMMFLALEDMTGSVEITVFPDAYERCGGELAPGSIALVRGRVERSRRGGDQAEAKGALARMVAFEVALLDDTEAVKALHAATPRRTRSGGSQANHVSRTNRTRKTAAPAAEPTPRPAPRERVHIRLPAAQAETNLLHELKQLLRRHRGDNPVLLHLLDEKSETNLALPRGYAVAASETLYQEIETFLGKGAVWRETL